MSIFKKMGGNIYKSLEHSNPVIGSIKAAVNGDYAKAGKTLLGPGLGLITDRKKIGQDPLAYLKSFGAERTPFATDNWNMAQGVTNAGREQEMEDSNTKFFEPSENAYQKSKGK